MMLNGGQIDPSLHHLAPHLSNQHHTTIMGQQSGGGQLGSHQLLSHTQQYQQGDLEPSRVAPNDLSNISHLKRSESYFMSDELRSEILRKNLLSLAVPSQEVAMRTLQF